MNITNFEFKAKATNISLAEENLRSLNPLFAGEDHQTDTYFNVAKGRLKLREGNIENALIWYQRENIDGAKQSDILLYKHEPEEALKNILIKVHGIKTIIKKRRKIYYIDNVKFHFDKVNDLGEFLEVEAIDKDNTIGIQKLKDQCTYYANFFKVNEKDYVQHSYSDMLLDKHIG
jgi:adenylate cyclase, class 2